MYALADTHPNPQFARARWQDLTGPWDFALDPDDAGRDARWASDTTPFTREITVPFPPESEASGIGDIGPHRVVWYRREVNTSSLKRAEGERVLLHLGAVDYRADVWVNGHHVAFHEGGHTPFSADITAELNATAAVIVVRAEDDPADLSQPRGKQDWQTPSHGIWYRRTTGIWQPVWLEVVGHHHIAAVYWRTDPATMTVEATVTVDPPPRDALALGVRLSLNGESLADDTLTVTVTGTLRDGRWAVGTPGDPDNGRSRLWSPEHPNLIEATLTLRDGDTVLDTVESYVGLRSAGTDTKHALVNGFPVYLRMVLEQGFWPESHLAAPSPEAIRREVELIRELGFNSARIHQKVEDPRFLAWCDRLGVMVWGEMANTFAWSDRAVSRVTKEWTDVVLRDRNHPSIIAWVPINESWGVPNLTMVPEQRHWQEALWNLTHGLDGSRPVISNDGWEQTTSDIVTIHDYTTSGDTIRARYGDADALATTLREGRPARRTLQLDGDVNTEQPVMITEYGGISYAPKAGERWYGYGTVTSEEDYVAKVRELTEAILDCPDVAGYCYTQFTDTEQETNGLLTEGREPKLPLETIQSIFGPKPGR